RSMVLVALTFIVGSSLLAFLWPSGPGGGSLFRSARALGLAGLGIGLSLCSVALLFAGSLAHLGFVPMLVLTISATGLSSFAATLGMRARRHVAPSAAEAMARDQRPPVVFLRSFRDDALKVAAEPAAPSLLEPGYHERRGSTLTFEQMLG